VQSSELRLPEDVVQYVRYFKQMIEAENVPEIHSLYEHGFPELTERFFREKLWPDDAAVEHIVGSGL
jgi:translation initiation factor 3 subunit L